MINLYDINYEYIKTEAKSVEIFNKINLNIEDNTFNAITGRSGAGKSTLLYIMSGLLRPIRGEVLFDDINIYSLSKNEKDNFINNNIGFVFQNFFLDNSFSALDNVILPLLARNIKLKDARAKGFEYLSLVGMEKRFDHHPNQLSGGEQQRVCLARALINGAKYIFADEPTGNLDRNNGLNIIMILNNLVKSHKKTVVMVTHNEEDCNIVDNHYIIKDGNIELSYA